MITLDSSILSHDVKIALCLQIQTQIYQSACRRLVPSLAGGHQSIRDLGYIVSVLFFAYPSSIDLAISRATHSDRSPSVIAYAAVPTQPCFLADWRASAQTVSCDRFLKRTLDGGLGYPTTCSYCIVGCLWLYIPVFRGITQIIWGCYSEGRTLSVWKLPLEKLFGIDDCFQLKDLSIYLYQVRCEYVITICLLK